MYSTYIKRIIRVEVLGATPEEKLSAAKEQKAVEEIISDTFFVEDDKGLIVHKEKVIYDGVGKHFVFES
jgi:hypothetical protein